MFSALIHCDNEFLSSDFRIYLFSSLLDAFLCLTIGASFLRGRNRWLFDRVSRIRRIQQQPLFAIVSSQDDQSVGYLGDIVAAFFSNDILNTLLKFDGSVITKIMYSQINRVEVCQTIELTLARHTCSKLLDVNDWAMESRLVTANSSVDAAILLPAGSAWRVVTGPRSSRISVKNTNRILAASISVKLGIA